LEARQLQHQQTDFPFHVQAQEELEANETSEERRARLKREIEQSDNALANELFGNGGSLWLFLWLCMSERLRFPAVQSKTIQWLLLSKA
jgi:hypothetical protein